MFQWTRINERKSVLMGIVQEQIKTHRDTFDPDNIRDLIDLCLEKQRGTSPDSHIFTGNHIW